MLLDLLGKIPILGNPAPYMAAALTRARLLHIDADAVLAASARSALFAKRLIVKLSSNMNAHMRDLEAFLLHPPVKRLANYLASQPAATTEDGKVIHFRVQKHVIASRLGMTPEALSRSLRALSDLGAIALGADHVCVIDDSLLHEIAQQP